MELNSARRWPSRSRTGHPELKKKKESFCTKSFMVKHPKMIQNNGYEAFKATNGIYVCGMCLCVAQWLVMAYVWGSVQRLKFTSFVCAVRVIWSKQHRISVCVTLHLSMFDQYRHTSPRGHLIALKTSQHMSNNRRCVWLLASFVRSSIS